MKKQVSIMDDISQIKKTNGSLVSFESSSKELFNLIPDLESIAIKELFLADQVRHIFICIYENYSGDMKRRIAGLSNRTDTDGLMDIASDISGSLGINLDRALRLVNESSVKE